MGLKALFALFLLCLPAQATFSIVAYDPETQSWGVAVQSKFFGVGSVVPWAKAGVGAIATQSYANTTYGPKGLSLMAAGHSSSNTLSRLVEADPFASRRQVGLIDAKGIPASFTGADCMAWAGQTQGTNFCVQGNILAGEAVIKEMAKAFEQARRANKGELADWMIAALVAGQAAGGDIRGQQSAAVLVVKAGAGYGGYNDRFVDIRIDDHPKPIDELARLMQLHKRFYQRK